MARIKFLYESSPFYGTLKPGDDLKTINGKVIHDLLDYMFWSTDGGHTVVTADRCGKTVTAEADVDDPDLRIEFDDFLLDKKRSCKNKCVFCFIDQLPKNMRDTLYYKDDDFRLSLLQGNYVTLTNVSEDDLRRMIDLKVSPLNVSVHTTNPDLRVRMMANPHAADINTQLKRLADAGINLRCQIVLCRELNDGKELDRTLNDLKALYPAVSSVSVVPVGLTKHREGLYPLKPFDKPSASEALNQVLAFGDECVKTLGTRFVFPADEFYVTADEPFPGYDFYEEFEQIENGVGLVMSFAQEFHDALRPLKPVKKKIDCTLVTGVAAEKLISTCLDALKKKCDNMTARLFAIHNEFFGESVTVTGLVTGGDIIAQLKDKEIGKTLIVPQAMLRDGEDTFLDDLTVGDVEKALHVRVKTVGNSAEEMIETVLSCTVG